MSLNNEYLSYPKRSYGMDHDRYTWSMLKDRQAVSWPGGAKLALWVNVSLQFFPLNQQGKPFPPPGGMTMPYPDLRHYTLRDYGNRVGIYRVLDALNSRGIPASFAVNGQLTERNPGLIREVADYGELIAHGWNMDRPHYGGMDPNTERELVKRSIDSLRGLSGQSVRGWLSPGRNESEQTPELLAENGIRYLCDWVNDDMPYSFQSAAVELTAIPLSTELEDRFVIQNNQHSEASWGEQVRDAADFLSSEAEIEGGRMLALSIHPWLLGQPHRIKHLEELLDYVLTLSPWLAEPTQILEHWQSQQHSNR